MHEFRKPIHVDEAITRVMSKVESLGSEQVELAAAYRRILAEPIIAKHDVPPFQRAPYDGFAIRSKDSIDAAEDQRISLHVVDHIAAGDITDHSLQQGEAVRIMTGAAMPAGADAVVMLEQARLSSDGTAFTIRKPFIAMENVSAQGEDARMGELLIEQGQVIHPGVIALLATFGYGTVQVARKPVVGVIVTGSELLEVDASLTAGKIRNSNGPMIEAQLARLGLSGRTYGILPDEMDRSVELVRQAAEQTDCLITTGGVSVGDYDYLPAIYERLGAEVLFNKIAMRPGSVTTVALWNGKLLFGLSGNPSACYTGFELLVRPVLLKLMGHSKPYLPHVRAVLAEDFEKANPFMRFIRAIYDVDGMQATVTLAGFNKSNAVSSIARGNAFIVLPGGTRGFHAGDEVDVLLLGTEEGGKQWNL